MKEIALANDAQPSVAPNHPKAHPVLGTIGALVSLTLWIGLAGIVYLQLPRAHKVFQDFDVEPGVLTKLTLEYMGLLFSLVAAITVIGLTQLSSRRACWLLAFVVPLTIFGGLVLTVGTALLKLLNDLS